jgi:parallel beta-helix repeat protein
MEAARYCALMENVITDVCRNAILLAKGCLANRIVGNEIARAGNTGISVSGRKLTLDAQGRRQGPAPTGHNVVTDNHVHHCGLVISKGTGISVGRSEQNLIAHNHVHDMPYIGVSMGGAFFDDWKEGVKNKARIPTQGNIIAYNHIHDVLQDMRDGAAIYSFGMMGVKSNTIRNNLIHHVGDEGIAVGIYLDDESDGFHVYDNVVSFAAVGLLLHGSTNNLIENNIFAFSKVADMWIHPEGYNVPPMENVLRRNIWYMGIGEPFKLIGTEPHKKRFWPKEPFKTINHNVYWRGGWPIELGLSKGFDADSVVADPRFFDPGRMDFRLRPGSPALKTGFKPIDLTDVGPRGQ